jgi:hypothetical protein
MATLHLDLDSADHAIASPHGDRLPSSTAPDAGKARLIFGIGLPIVDTVQQVSYVPASRCSTRRCRTVDTLLEIELSARPGDDPIATVDEHECRITSPHSLCLIEHVHGAPTRRAVDATAFAVRDEHVPFVAIASWDPIDDPRHIQWARASWNATQAWSANRVYMNILGADGGDRVAEAYSPNYRRLAQVKAKFDPLTVFRINQNVVPVALLT